MKFDSKKCTIVENSSLNLVKFFSLLAFEKYVAWPEIFLGYVWWGKEKLAVTRELPKHLFIQGILVNVLCLTLAEDFFSSLQISGHQKTTKIPKKLPKQGNFPFPVTFVSLSNHGFYCSGATGEKVIDVKVPDTITTWYASGFAISGKDGLGVANPAEIRGFKAVFVSVNLPYSVIRGELVTIPVVAFNYLSSCLNVSL